MSGGHKGCRWLEAYVCVLIVPEDGTFSTYEVCLLREARSTTIICSTRKSDSRCNHPPKYILPFSPPRALTYSVQTNAYVKHCTTEPPAGEPDTRKDHQKAKSATAGFKKLNVPVDCEGGAFEEGHIHGMVGIIISMGLTRKFRMRNHWGEGPHDNYPLVRQCMQRDLFELLYCRFLHWSDPNAPPRKLPDGEDNPAFDSKWHIRCVI